MYTMQNNYVQNTVDEKFFVMEVSWGSGRVRYAYYSNGSIHEILYPQKGGRLEYELTLEEIENKTELKETRTRVLNAVEELKKTGDREKFIDML